MNSNRKRIISILVTVLFLSLFVWYFFTNINDFKILLELNLWSVFILIPIAAGSIILNGIFMKWTVGIFGKHISTTESVRVSLISTAGNFFAPAGSGLGIRAVYLKKVHKLAYSDYISIVLCNYVIVFFVISLFGLIALFLLREHSSTPGFYILLATLTLLLLASIGVAFLSRLKITKKNSKVKLINFFIGTLKRIQQGWKLLGSRKRVVLGLIAITVTGTILLIVSAYITMAALGIKLGFAELLLYSVLGSLSVFINITPGNLGVKEGVFVATSSILGLTASEVLSVSIVERVVMFALLFVLWLIYGRGITQSKQDIESSAAV